MKPIAYMSIIDHTSTTDIVEHRTASTPIHSTAIPTTNPTTTSTLPERAYNLPRIFPLPHKNPTFPSPNRHPAPPANHHPSQHYHAVSSWPSPPATSSSSSSTPAATASPSTTGAPPSPHRTPSTPSAQIPHVVVPAPTPPPP